ncbi:diacylglycerol kinase family protein [Paenibacillus sp. Z6-24]
MKKRTWRAVFYSAIEGVIATFRTERNFRVHVLATMVIIVAGWYFHVDIGDWMLLTLAIAMVLGAELMNTAVEAAVDLCSPDWHPFAKKAKDAAAGAVLVASLAAAVIGIAVFIGPVLSWLNF